MGQARRNKIQAIGAPKSAPERITSDEATYLIKVCQGAQEAEQLEQQIQQLEQQIQLKRQQATALAGARDSYVGHLFERYSLDTRTDSIDMDTREIKRAEGLTEALQGAVEPVSHGLD